MLNIDVKSRKPIYEQIIDNIKELIVQGIWPRDTQLPSVRQLAGELAINPNTIQKAYSELERQGIIYSIKSKGSFVASSVDDLRRERQKQVATALCQNVAELCALGMSKAEIESVVEGEIERSMR